MNLKPILLGVVAVLVAAMYFYSAQRGAPVNGGETAQSLVASGALLVDVRSPEEFGAGHLPGARNIPIDTFGSRIAELGPPATTSVVVYCKSGGRSTKAAKLLRDAGFTAVHNLGPMSAWETAPASAPAL